MTINRRPSHHLTITRRLALASALLVPALACAQAGAVWPS